MGRDVLRARQVRLLVPETLFLRVRLCMTDGWLAQSLSVARRLRVGLRAAVHATRLQVHVFVHLLV